MGNLKGNGNFHFPFGKLWELSPFPQNFPSKKCGEISSFFAVIYLGQHIFLRSNTAFQRSIAGLQLAVDA